jgi:hypothetical protein
MTDRAYKTLLTNGNRPQATVKLPDMMLKFHWSVMMDKPCLLLCVSSLKQQSAGRHIATLGHIILIPSQPVFALSP